MSVPEQPPGQIWILQRLDALEDAVHRLERQLEELRGGDAEMIVRLTEQENHHDSV